MIVLLLLGVSTGARRTGNAGWEITLKAKKNTFHSLAQRNGVEVQEQNIYLHGVNSGSHVRASNSCSFLNIPLALINRSLSLQTRVAFELIKRFGRLRSLVGCTRGEMLIPKATAFPFRLRMTKRRDGGRTRAASAACFAASASLRAFFSTSSESSRVDASALAH